MMNFAATFRKYLLVILVLVVLTSCTQYSGTSSIMLNASTSSSVKYLGMENGSLSLSDKNIKKYAKYMNLDTSMPTIENLYYANGVYLATTKKYEIYRSKNLKKWEKIKQKTSKNYIILTDPPRGFLLINKNKYYTSLDGKKWKQIKGIEKFFKNNKPQAFFKNKIISYGYKENKSKKFGKYKAVYTNKVHSFVNDGKYLIALDVVRVVEDNFDRNNIQFSLDGLKWRSTNIYTNYGYYSSLKCMPNYNNKKILEIYTYDCSDTFYYYSHKLENGRVQFKKEKKLKYFKGQLTAEKSLFNICAGQDTGGGGLYPYSFDYDEMFYQRPYLDKGVYQETFEKNVFQNDLLMVQDFIGYIPAKGWHEETISVLNGKFYYFGKYGGIIEIDKNFNQKWVGLYPREPLSRENMTDPLLGGKIGIVEKDGVLWYANTKYPGENAFYKVYSSVDGVSWKCEFTDKENSKIDINKLVIK